MRDRRIEKTKEAIKNSFFELLNTKNAGKISVTELCQNANINRCTFYSHYRDIPDLYEAMEKELAEEFVQALEQYHYDMDSQKSVTMLFESARKHKQLFSLMFSPESPGIAAKIIQEMTKERTLKVWMEESDLAYEEAEVLFTYITAGGQGILKHWIETDFAMDDERVKYLFDQITKYGLYNFVYIK